MTIQVAFGMQRVNRVQKCFYCKTRKPLEELMIFDCKHVMHKKCFFERLSPSCIKDSFVVCPECKKGKTGIIDIAKLQREFRVYKCAQDMLEDDNDLF